MNLEERLRKLKQINPRTEYSERSRAFILSTAQEEARPRITVWQFFVQNLQFGSAVALTGLLLLLGFGGFSAWKFLSPFGLSSLDPANLRAEAEVVNDFGVALNSIQYIPSPTPAALPAPKNTQAMKAAGARTMSLSAPAEGVSSEDTMAAADTSSSLPDFSTTTVDQALDFLLQ